MYIDRFRVVLVSCSAVNRCNTFDFGARTTTRSGFAVAFDHHNPTHSNESVHTFVRRWQTVAEWWQVRTSFGTASSTEVSRVRYDIRSAFTLIRSHIRVDSGDGESYHQNDKQFFMTHRLLVTPTTAQTKQQNESVLSYSIEPHSRAPIDTAMHSYTGNQGVSQKPASSDDGKKGIAPDVFHDAMPGRSRHDQNCFHAEKEPKNQSFITPSILPPHSDTALCCDMLFYDRQSRVHVYKINQQQRAGFKIHARVHARGLHGWRFKRVDRRTRRKHCDKS